MVRRRRRRRRKRRRGLLSGIVKWEVEDVCGCFIWSSVGGQLAGFLASGIFRKSRGSTEWRKKLSDF